MAGCVAIANPILATTTPSVNFLATFSIEKEKAFIEVISDKIIKNFIVLGEEFICFDGVAKRSINANESLDNLLFSSAKTTTRLILNKGT
mmetsp:Transcript_15129/g.16779  ORF Transcript_15129/g.16779 Transcript_15129/m.16779 type:complete len:90 (+) Transcript_15129:403-672(+)